MSVILCTGKQMFPSPNETITTPLECGSIKSQWLPKISCNPLSLMIMLLMNYVFSQQLAMTTRYGTHDALLFLHGLLTYWGEQILGSALWHLLSHDSTCRLPGKPSLHITRQAIPRRRGPPHGQALRYQILESQSFAVF